MNKLIRTIVAVFTIGLTSVPLLAQGETELTKLADYFSKYYQYADETRMTEALAEDFRYFTNVPCIYKDCATGATKANYIAGIMSERGPRGFVVESISMKFIAPITGVITDPAEPKVSFYCILETEARGNTYKTYSIIDYFFRKSNGAWKITRIENRIINR